MTLCSLVAQEAEKRRIIKAQQASPRVLEMNMCRLHLAAGKGNVAEVRAMLARGAWRELDARDPTGATAFIMACSSGRTECAEALLDAGCDATVTSFGFSGPQHAEICGHPGLAERLRARLSESETEAPSSVPVGARFMRGSAVELHGLASEAGRRLNGLTGRVQRFDQAAGRVAGIVDRKLRRVLFVVLSTS